MLSRSPTVGIEGPDGSVCRHVNETQKAEFPRSIAPSADGSKEGTLRPKHPEFCGPTIRDDHPAIRQSSSGNDPAKLVGRSREITANAERRPGSNPNQGCGTLRQRPVFNDPDSQAVPDRGRLGNHRGRE